jgi:tripartite-type tricarboxylate transporter receptor subunit TctC
MKGLRVSGIILLSLAVLSMPAEAQWPSEMTVRIVVPFAAGGIGDVLMRLLAQEVSGETKQKIISMPA